jgi:glutamine synthetase
MLAAGIDGVINKIEPPENVDKNIFRMTPAERAVEGIRSLPWNLQEANNALIQDELLCNVLGEHILAQVNYICELEWADYSRAITDWEIKRYLPNY